VSCAITGGPILIICTLYDLFCANSSLLGVEMIAPALKFLVALILLIAINSLMR